MILLLVIAVSPASMICAQEKIFVIGVENIEYYPLYAYRDGKYIGYSREILDAFAKEQGYTFKYKPLPVLRLFKRFLEEQTLDLKYPDNEYWQAEMREGNTIHYSEPVIDYIDGVVVLPENKGKGVEHLKHLGVVLGFTAWEYLEDIEAGRIKQEGCTNYISMLEITKRKRIDGAYGNIDIAKYHLENTMKQPDALVFDPDLPYTKSSYRLSSIKYPEVIQEFSTWLIEHKEFVENLKAKYKVGLDF
jgi:hypothetical protein